MGNVILKGYFAANQKFYFVKFNPLTAQCPFRDKIWVKNGSNPEPAVPLGTEYILYIKTQKSLYLTIVLPILSP
jgi:hypothetical protein